MVIYGTKFWGVCEVIIEVGGGRWDAVRCDECSHGCGLHLLPKDLYNHNIYVDACKMKINGDNLAPMWHSRIGMLLGWCGSGGCDAKWVLCGRIVLFAFILWSCVIINDFGAFERSIVYIALLVGTLSLISLIAQLHGGVWWMGLNRL